MLAVGIFTFTFRILRLAEANAMKIEEANKVSGPKYLILGAQKSGTTALNALLIRHPQVCSAYDPITGKQVKEVLFASGAAYSPASYGAYFSGCKKENIAGYIDSTPQLDVSAYGIHTMLRLMKNFEDKRVIIILREPVSREYSAYVMFFDKCLGIFKEARDEGFSYEHTCNKSKLIDSVCSRFCDNKKVREAKSTEQLRHAFYKFSDMEALTTFHSQYYKQIQGYLRVFKREQMLIISMEYLIRSTTDLSKRLASFMGLDSDWGDNVILPQENVQRDYQSFALDCASLHYLRGVYKTQNEMLYSFMAQGGGPPEEPPFTPFPDPKLRACVRRENATS